jgi:hypothetical protein
MLNFKLLHSLMIAGLFAVGGVAHAAVIDFGSLKSASSGYTAPDSFASDSFAQLKAFNMGGGVWKFKLAVNDNVLSSFGDNAFLKLVNLDFTVNPASLPESTLVKSNAGGVSSVSSKDGNGKKIDFSTVFGSAGDRLSQNDWVTWTVSGLDPDSKLKKKNLSIVVAGIDGGYHATYSPSVPAITSNFAPIVSAVPEPVTYAMLLAGLGLIGFSARRRA